MTDMLNGGHAAAFVNIFLLGLLFVVGIAIARLRNLFAIAMLSGVYSLVSAVWYVLVDAVDVAFTEAAVGAGLSTAVILAALLLTARSTKPVRTIRRLGPLLICVVTAALLVYGAIDLPRFGDPASPANAGVGLTYLRINWFDTHVPNVVTSVLASYRGFDTLGETVVVFAAGLGVTLLLGFGERSLAETIRRARRTAPKASRAEGSAA